MTPITINSVPNTEKDYYVTESQLKQLVSSILFATLPTLGANIGDLQTGNTQGAAVYIRTS